MRKATLAVLVASIVSQSGLAAAQDAATCNEAKFRAVSRASVSLLKCRAKAVQKAEPIDADCGTKASDRLASTFADAIAAGGCPTTDDAADVEVAITSYDHDLADFVAVASTPDPCASAKVRAAGKRVKKQLSCLAVGGTAGGTACYAEAMAKMVKAYEKRDDSGDCNTTGDAAAVQALTSEYLEYVAARIEGTVAPAHPSGLSAAIDLADVDLSWTPADPGSGLTEVRVLRKLGGAVAGPDDGSATVIYEGSASSTTDAVTNLLPNTVTVPRTYHYAAYGCDTMDNCETTGSSVTLTPALVEVLRAGGYVLHWRHASATICADNLALGTADTTASPDWWKSCDSNCGTATARQLNATGLIESETLGNDFETLGIPVGRIRSSEFCRNFTTASLMDFGPATELEEGLTFFVYDEAGRCASSFAMLAEVPPAGSNTALIGHAGNTCPPLSELAWAEAAIYKPDGMGSALFIARMPVDAWLPAHASGLDVTIDGADVELDWTLPLPTSGLTEVRVLRKLNGAVTGPDDVAATVVYEGTASSTTDAVADLLPDTTSVARTYHYAVYGCDNMDNCEAVGSSDTLTPTLVQVLRAGGYVLHWRHASATICNDNTALGTADTTASPDWWKSCDSNCGTATARQLNATGVTEATAIGQDLETLGIPVGRVRSSEFCRNFTTASLMDFGPATELEEGLTFFVHDEAGRCASSFAMLAEVPTAGTNSALIGHAGNTCPPLSDLAWAEAAIYKPDGMGSSLFIARVPVNTWLSLP